MDNLEIILELLRADRRDDVTLFTLSGILLGLTISVIASLYSKESKTRLNDWAYGIFTFSAISFLGSTLLSMMILESISAVEMFIRTHVTVPELRYRDTPRDFCYMIFFIGLLCSGLGICLLGFLKSRFIGFVAIAAVAIISFAIILSIPRMDFYSDLISHENLSSPNNALHGSANSTGE